MNEEEAKKLDERITSALQKAIDPLNQFSVSFTKIDLKPLAATLGAFKKLRPLLDTPNPLMQDVVNTIAGSNKN